MIMFYFLSQLTSLSICFTKPLENRYALTGYISLYTQHKKGLTLMKPVALPKSHFKHSVDITTRWSDNDIYGHVNNVMYYSFFDTAVNTYLIEQAELDIHNGNTIGLVVSSSCDYFAPVSFPDKLAVGISVTKIGNSSVSYQVAVFDADDCSIQGDDSGATAVAQGKFVHVWAFPKLCVTAYNPLTGE